VKFIRMEYLENQNLVACFYYEMHDGSSIVLTPQLKFYEGTLKVNWRLCAEAIQRTTNDGFDLSDDLHSINLTLAKPFIKLISMEARAILVKSLLDEKSDIRYLRTLLTQIGEICDNDL